MENKKLWCEYSGDSSEIKQTLVDEDNSDTIASLVSRHQKEYPGVISKIDMAIRMNTGRNDWLSEVHLLNIASPVLCRYQHIDSKGGSLFKVSTLDQDLLDPLMEKLDFPFLDKPRFVLPYNGAEIYSASPIAVCEVYRVARDDVNYGSTFTCFKDYFLGPNCYETISFMNRMGKCGPVVFQG